jgi:hypothetical protein
MTQIVAGILAFTALVFYGWTAVRVARYVAPWSAPWHIGTPSQWSALGNAALRAVVLGGLAVVLVWPYFQGQQSFAFSHVHPLPVLRPPSVSGSVDLTWVLLALGIAGFAGLCFLATQFVHRNRNVEPKAQSVLRSTDVPTLRDLTDQALMKLIAAGDARRAILACYGLMESGLAKRGMPRRPEETALEYSERLLTMAGAPPGPVRALTALFHLAGFSSQTINETMRQTAISSLRAIGEAAQ